MPVPRALFGADTNAHYSELSSDVNFWKFGKDDTSKLPVHMTVEFVERRTSLRFARTYMLSNCSQNYMEGYNYNDEPVLEIDEGAKFNEQSSNFLLHAYISLIKTFHIIKNMYFEGKISKTDSHKISYA